MNRIALDFGIVQIYWYSIIILIGMAVGMVVILAEAKRKGLNTDVMTDLLFYTIIWAIIGARLYYVIFNFDEYSNNILEVFEIWTGGLAIHGGILFGGLYLLFAVKKRRMKGIKIFDMCVPGLLIGQAIGRWGNFFNGEAYGTVVEYETLVNLRIIPQFVIDNMYINGSYHLPMFYFESIACFIGFIIMIIMRRKKYIKRGQILAFYLLWYGLVRFIVEIYRTDSLMFVNIKMAQLISVVMVIIGAYITSVQSKKPTLEELYNTTDDTHVAF